MSYGHRKPTTYTTQLARKHLNILRAQYLDLRDSLRDPRMPVSVSFLKRLAAMRNVLEQHGVKV